MQRGDTGIEREFGGWSNCNGVTAQECENCLLLDAEFMNKNVKVSEELRLILGRGRGRWRGRGRGKVEEGVIEFFFDFVEELFDLEFIFDLVIGAIIHFPRPSFGGFLRFRLYSYGNKGSLSTFCVSYDFSSHSTKTLFLLKVLQT